MTRKILIVDDSMTTRIMLRKMLEAEYSILEAGSGEDALALLNLEYRTISAVLLDIGLPGVDGYSVLTKIRADKRFSNMPVIIITASNDEATRVKALSLKANDFLMKPYQPEILKHCLQNNIALNEATAANERKTTKLMHWTARKPMWSLRGGIIFSCIFSLLLSILIQHFTIQGDLRRTSETVIVDFSEIMDSYEHSFQLFELLLQQEIQNAKNPDEIEAFLKAQDKRLFSIEGGDYDGVYMYYQGRYLYSWDTPYSAYADTGYDATKRPWYIGAVKANGALFFSTPYPSYANDYMLATISRLQDDGETVIAYDIKLGEIGKYVNRLYLYNGALALICDADGHIIGSTDSLYQGGNYTLSPAQLTQAVTAAQAEVEKAGTADEEAVRALKSAEAQQQFVAKEGKYLYDLLLHEGTLQYSVTNLSFGYAFSNGTYTCFVVTPIVTILPQVAILWAAFSFAFIVVAFLIDRLLRKNHQILSDPLTGLNNRRAFLKYCNNHFLHHEDKKLGLLMLDLNHFKKINDLYGHAVGDQALLDTAAVLRNACGASPNNYFLCRYGGDEFLLATRAPNDTALEQMRLMIADSFKRKNRTSMTPYTLEASMGISCDICKDKKSLEHLLALADQAMYEDKKRLSGNSFSM